MDNIIDEDIFSNSRQKMEGVSHHKYLVARELVAPEVYNLSSRLCFTKFLDRFETYFHRQYDGSEEDCCRVLGQFLEGEIKEVYKICGGEYAKLNSVKPRLLHWYDSVQWLRKHKIREEFEDMTMKNRESFTIYLMRLESIAALAYPMDAERAKKERKRKLLETVPKCFLDLIEQKKTINEMMGRSRKLSWSDLLELAKIRDERILKSAYGNKDKLKLSYLHFRPQEHAQPDPISIQENQDINVSMVRPSNLFQANVQVESAVLHVPPPNQPSPLCTFCGKCRHSEDQCRFKNKSCFHCGSLHHLVAKCPAIGRTSCPENVRSRNTQILRNSLSDSHSGSVGSSLNSPSISRSPELLSTYDQTRQQFEWWEVQSNDAVSESGSEVGMPPTSAGSVFSVDSGCHSLCSTTNPFLKFQSMRNNLNVI